MAPDCQLPITDIFVTFPATGIRAFSQSLGKRHLYYYAIDDGKSGCVLVDAGLPGSVRSALEHDLLEEAVQSLIITHSDADHLGDAAYVAKQFPGLQIACHEKDKRWCEHHDILVKERYDCIRQKGFNFGYPPEILKAMREACGPDFAVNHTLTPGPADGVLGKEWTVVTLPGHSPGHIGLWRESDGVLIAGDAVLGMGPPDENGISSMPPTHQYIMDYLATVSLLRSLPVKLALTGHWPPLNNEAFTCLLDDSEHCVRRDISWVLEASKHCPISFGDIVQGLNSEFRTWDTVEDVHYFYAVSGYVERLQEVGLIQKKGDLFFRA